MEFFTIDINWALVLQNLVQLGIAFLLAMPIAVDREKASRSAGLRTFPLVAIPPMPKRVYCRG